MVLDEQAIRPARGTKTGRNEQLKLLGTLLNNLSAAAAVTALFQPALALIVGQRLLSWRDAAAALVFGVLASILHLVARRLVARLED